MKKASFFGLINKNSENYYNIKKSKKNLNKNYYFLSNDILKIKIRKHSIKESPVLIGIANHHFLHFIYSINNINDLFLKRIIAVDYNIDQLEHLKKIIYLIIKSKNRIDFVEKIFNLKLNDESKKILNQLINIKNNYIHGEVKKDKYYSLEKQIWENSLFNESNFFKNFKLKAKKTKKGLLIKSKVIGGFEEYYSTIISCSKLDYNKKVFTLGFGFGYLENEKSFSVMKDILKKIPIYYIKSDISNIYEELLLTNKYFPILFWSSNIFDKYFLDMNKNLKKIIEISNKLGTQKEPFFPEIDITVFQDERIPNFLNYKIRNFFLHKRKLSIHSKSFLKVSKHIEGDKNIELVNMKNWIDKDNGISKLYRTEYMHIDEFNKLSTKQKFDTIFVHILVGHGVKRKEYDNILKKSKLISKRIIILEHNKYSNDFKKEQIGMSVEDIRDLIGKEDILEYCEGYKSKDRNILMVYRNNN